MVVTWTACAQRFATRRRETPRHHFVQPRHLVNHPLHAHRHRHLGHRRRHRGRLRHHHGRRGPKCPSRANHIAQDQEQ